MQLFAQAELKPYGNLEGIRIKGQLMPFNTRIVVVGKSWSKIYATGKEQQKPKYDRKDDEQIVTTQIDSFHFIETVTDAGRGKIKVNIKCFAGKDTAINSIYLDVSLPESIYGNSQVKAGKGNEEAFSQSDYIKTGEHFLQDANEISFTATDQNIRLSFEPAIANMLKRDTGKQKYIQLYFPICQGSLTKNNIYERNYEIKVSGNIDDFPALIKLDTTVQGRPFDGFGGNFRLQNPKDDPEVIDYCLKNMRVAWGRVEMPWSNWQPDSSVNPLNIDTANQNVHVKRAMEMAQRLSRMNIPVILTAWFPPQWAVEGKLNFEPTPEGIWGNPLKRSSMPKIYQSIADYIIYLKEHYGVDVTYFSFNESDLGINIRQTGEEHDELIKGLGAYFVSRGLKTKLLLGDNSDATTYKFIYPAMNDPEAKPYLGAVSFHSWRGWDSETLQKWRDAAKQTGLPLIVGEGSIDAAAWGYPKYFEEQSYALEEINLYTRLLAICQPLSILQWQLTSDYSPLKGGGIFVDNGPLEPTQRFWDMKQLASTPKDLYHMNISCDNAEISCAALGDNAKHAYTIHIVNNGTSRKVHLTGLPSEVKAFNVYITNADKGMKRSGSLKVKDHEADLKLEKRSYITLISQ
jgi:hypothetical protein